MRRSISILFVFLIVVGMGLPLAAQPKPFPKPFRPPFTTESLWKQLMKGNTEYQGGALPYTDIDDARDRTKEKQKPWLPVGSVGADRHLRPPQG